MPPNLRPFYDTGLLCWLLGIRNSRELATHPLRGSIFESFVLSELAKARRNRTETPGLHFWRDNNGNEVDVIAEVGLRLMPIEMPAFRFVVVVAAPSTGRDPLIGTPTMKSASSRCVRQTAMKPTSTTATQATSDDDAPKLTQTDLDHARYRLGGQSVNRTEWQTAVRARTGKHRVNIMLDLPIVEHFKALAGERDYQTLINDTLRRVIESEHLETDLRRIIREELEAHG